MLTDVRSMTNMPENRSKGNYTHFAIVTATVCVPFLILIGSLNTHRGMQWWRAKTRLVWDITSSTSVWIAKGGPFARKSAPQSQPELPRTKSFESASSGAIKPLEPTLTMSGEMMRRRQRRLSGRRDSRGGFDKVVEPTARGEVPGIVENGLLKAPTVAGAPTPSPTTPPPSALASMWQNERRQRLRYSEDV